MVDKQVSSSDLSRPVLRKYWTGNKGDCSSYCPLSCVSLINTIFIIINRLPDIYNDRLPAIPT